MNKTDRESCINTIKTLRRLALNIHGCIDAVDDQNCDKMIEILKSEPHWIPVTERPPEKEGCYLVSVKNDHERRYSKTAWFGKDGWFARQDVIAWMPLPEPYKGVTE